MKSRQWLGGLAATVALAGITSAEADVPPWAAPPEFLDRDYGNELRQAGHDCPRVTGAQPTEDPAYKNLAWGEQSPLVVTCSNERRFLLAVPPKQPLMSREPLPPPPAERIRPL